METEEARLARQALKTHPLVAEAIKRLTNLAGFVDGQLTKAPYKKYMRAVALCMREPLDPDEMQFLLEQDWENDSKGQSALSVNQLFDSMFELVDVWTQSIQPEEYVSMADELTRKVSALL